VVALLLRESMLTSFFMGWGTAKSGLAGDAAEGVCNCCYCRCEGAGAATAWL
jgi:hypothetical protein